MTKREASQARVGQKVRYIPGHRQEAEFGRITSTQEDEHGIRIFVCYDSTGRGQLTPYEDLI